MAPDAEVDFSAPWQLSDQVSLRDEPFGALAYHHGTRRLLFLRSHALVGLVRQLCDHNSATEALADLPESAQSACARALMSLAASDIIRVR